MVRLTYEEAHEVLGIQVGASEDQVKKAYKRKALACHPDRNPDDPEAKEKFQRVSAAYKRISEPEAEEEDGDEQGFNEDDLMNMFMSMFFAGGRPGGGFPGSRGPMPMPGFFGGFSVNDFGDDSDEEEDSDDDDDDDDDPLRNLLFAHVTMGSMFGDGMDHDEEEEENSGGDDEDEYYRHCMEDDDAEMFIRAAMGGGIFGMGSMGEMNMGGRSSRGGGRGGYRGRGSSRSNAGFPAPRCPGPSPSASSSSRRGRGGSMNAAGSAGRGGAGAGRGGRWGETAPAQQAQQAQPQGDSKSKKRRERRRRNKEKAQAGEGGGAAAGANPSRAAGGPNVYRK